MQSPFGKFCILYDFNQSFNHLYLHLTILLAAICHAVVSKPEILIVMTLHITVCNSRSPQSFTNCVSLFVNLAHLGNFEIVQFPLRLSSFHVTKYLLHKNALHYPPSCNNPLDVQCNCTRTSTVLVPLVCQVQVPRPCLTICHVGRRTICPLCLTKSLLMSAAG